MEKIIFNGKNSETILATKLFLCEFNSSDELPYVEREVIKGETTINRNIAPSYGSKYTDVINKEFALVKEDKSAFDKDDIRAIERWLISSKKKKLTIVEEDGEETNYKGYFTKIAWKRIGANVVGATVNFENDSPFSYKTVTFESESIKDGDTITLKCDSDDIENPIYPKIVIFNLSLSDKEFTFDNYSHNDISAPMVITIPKNTSITIDCALGTIKRTNATEEAALGRLTYEEVGWSNKENISWLELFAGNNIIKITGYKCKVSITYEVPQKSLGGLM